MLLYVPSFINCEQSVIFFRLKTLPLLIVVKEKFTEKNENFYANVLPKTFHFNRNTLGFRPQMKSYIDPYPYMSLKYCFVNGFLEKYHSSKLRGRIFFTDAR